MKEESRPTTSTRQRAIETLRQGILTFQYQPGDRLVERELTEEIGISRATLREAYGELRSEGLVELVPGRGATVARLNRRDARDLYEVRIRLESLIVERFSGNASGRHLVELHDALDEVERVGASDPDIAELLCSKDAFFEVLVDGADSPVLSQQIGMIQARIRQLRAMSMSAPGRPNDTVNELRAVIDALENRDATRAAELYEQHLRNAMAISLERFGP